MHRMPLPRRSVAVLLAATALACERAPRPIVAGTDECAYCRMTVSDLRFGAEVQSGTGKIHVFDSIECLASFYLDAIERQDVQGVWVTAFESGRMVPADSASYLVDSSIQSPMGRSIVAFMPTAVARDTLVARFGGAWQTWDAVTDALRTDRIRPGADTASSLEESHR